MKIEPTRAARNAPTRGSSPAHSTAAAVPTSTGAIAAGSVLGLAAITQILIGQLPSAMTESRAGGAGGGGSRTARGLPAAPPSPCDRTRAPTPSRSPRELAEIGRSFLLEGLAPLPSLLAAVEEQVGVVGQLLDPGVAVLMGIEAGLDQAQGEGGEGEHLAAPGDRLPLQVVERDDLVDQSHPQGLLGVVEAAEQPELLCALGPDKVTQEGGAEAAVPGADPWAGLAEAGVVGGDRQGAADVQHMAATARMARHHRHHRLWQPPHLHLQVGDVEAPDRRALGEVAAVAADLLVAAGAERPRPLAGEDDRPDLGVLARQLERGGDLDQRLRPEGVVDLRSVDR